MITIMLRITFIESIIFTIHHGQEFSDRRLWHQLQSNLLGKYLEVAHQICTSHQRYLLSVLVDILYMS